MRRTPSGETQIRICDLVVQVFYGLMCRLYVRISFLEKGVFLIVVRRALMCYCSSTGLYDFSGVTSEGFFIFFFDVLCAIMCFR